MAKLIEIKLTKCTLILEESELMRLIPPNVFEKGLKMGKAIQRNRNFNERLKGVK